MTHTRAVRTAALQGGAGGSPSKEPGTSQRLVFGTAALSWCQPGGESSPLPGGVILGNNESHLGQVWSIGQGHSGAGVHGAGSYVDC